MTDAGLAHCGALGALRHLELPSCWRLTDAGLRQLTRLTGLSHLDLSYCWQARRPAPRPAAWRDSRNRFRARYLQQRAPVKPRPVQADIVCISRGNFQIVLRRRPVKPRPAQVDCHGVRCLWLHRGGDGQACRPPRRRLPSGQGRHAGSWREEPA